MFDSIAYIPMILAYLFISLLFVILCFIVIYVSHKIYISIYDNLPVLNTMSRSLLTAAESQTDKHNKPECLHLARKSKTALRIVVTLEPCYLAFGIFETTKQQQQQMERQQESEQEQQLLALDSCVDFQNALRNNQFIQFFDRLTSIPMIKKCHINNKHQLVS